MYQLLMSPLMKPEMITNSSTRTLTAVKTLFTVADSFAPNARIPTKKSHKYKVRRVFAQRERSLIKNTIKYKKCINNNFPLFILDIEITKIRNNYNKKCDYETRLPAALWEQLQRSLGKELIQVNPSQPVCPESWRWHFQWGHRRSHSMPWLHSMSLINSERGGDTKWVNSHRYA